MVGLLVLLRLSGDRSHQRGVLVGGAPSDLTSFGHLPRFPGEDVVGTENWVADY